MDTSIAVDYLVVGAGAAGCSLAWQLRQASRDVCVLELKDLHGKEKLCGSLISHRALQEIDTIFGEGSTVELGIAFRPCLHERCLGHEILTYGDWATLPRKRLDDWLLARCLAASATVRDRMRLTSVDERAHEVVVRDLRGGDRVRIRYGALVGADGASSIVRLLLSGRRQRAAMSLEGYVPQQGQDIVFSYPVGKLGYSWYNPTGEVATVGCGLYGESVADVRACVVRFCEELDIARPKLRGAAVPTGDDVLLRAGEDVWLVGDAAGLAWPTNGCGISHALASSRLLAASLAGGTPYEEAMEPVLAAFAERANKRNTWFFETWIRICKGPKMGVRQDGVGRQ